MKKSVLREKLKKEREELMEGTVKTSLNKKIKTNKLNKQKKVRSK